MALARRSLLLCLTISLGTAIVPVFAQDIDQVLARGNALLEESKAAYEAAKAESAVDKFVIAGFKLEEARAKFLAVQEFAQGDKLKAAQDQLKIVGQLAKLIHDGKVAISGTPKTDPPAPEPPSKNPPAPPPSPAPPAAPPNSPPPGAPPPAPPAGADPAPPRIPIPDAAQVRDAEKTVRDMYKADYAKKQAPDRQALAKRLLKQGRESAGDPVAQWVLLHEAQDVASQIADTETALEAIQALASLFEFDVPGMKAAALAGSLKVAKTPEEMARVAEQYLKLSEEAVAGDNYELAEKAVQAASVAAKRSGYVGLAARASSRPKEVAEAKARFEKLRKAYDALARDVNDPAANLEIGIHLCFTKGEWDAGLVFLSKGSDPALSSVSLKDLQKPEAPERQIEVADGWWDLAEKEKVDARKQALYLMAGRWYERARPSTSGLVKAKVETRLEAIRLRKLMQGLEIILGPRMESRGLVIGECGDGLYEPGVANGKPSVKLIKNPGPNSRYLYLHLTEPWTQESRPAEVEVEYLDEGGGVFEVEFDAVSGPYKNTGKSVPLGTSRSWKVATFLMPDPAFRGRLNAGADFRLRRGDGGDLTVHRIVLRLAAR